MDDNDDGETRQVDCQVCAAMYTVLNDDAELHVCGNCIGGYLAGHQHGRTEGFNAAKTQLRDLENQLMAAFQTTKRSADEAYDAVAMVTQLIEARDALTTQAEELEAKAAQLGEENGRVVELVHERSKDLDAIIDWIETIAPDDARIGSHIEAMEAISTELARVEGLEKARELAEEQIAQAQHVDEDRQQRLIVMGERLLAIRNALAPDDPDIEDEALIERAHALVAQPAPVPSGIRLLLEGGGEVLEQHQQVSEALTRAIPGWFQDLSDSDPDVREAAQQVVTAAVDVATWAQALEEARRGKS